MCTKRSDLGARPVQPPIGGVIAVDKDGNYVFAFNTTSMLRGVADSEGKFETEIWK